MDWQLMNLFCALSEEDQAGVFSRVAISSGCGRTSARLARTAQNFAYGWSRRSGCLRLPGGALQPGLAQFG